MKRLAHLLLSLGLLLVSVHSIANNAKILDFPQAHFPLSKDVQEKLNSITTAQWITFVNSGIDSFNRQKRLEENLLNSHIIVQNGSLSHAQLLDTLPNEKSKLDSDVALKVLKSSLFVFNSKCLPQGISGDECREFLETKPLPEGSILRIDCDRVLHSIRDGHHAFRRLQPRHYKNGFHEMFEEENLPGAWAISMALYDRENETALRTGQRTSTNPSSQPTDSRNLNLVLVQFAQFVEHDLSKTVSQSMSNGSPIECCNSNQNHLQPRFNHPHCAPILAKDKYDWPNCLSYVRSALAVGDSCNYGAAEQLNQATGVLDLSQLYGYTDAAERKMRTLSHGILKSSSGGKLLPLTSNEEGHTFCAWGSKANATNCFTAGDSRVNINPFSILIYTIFLRNHNRIAAELHSRNKQWSDEQLFQAAKTVNIEIYRQIVLREWLPEVLGQESAEAVLATPPLTPAQRPAEVSNEFGVAAIRFYFSMIPNVLHNLAVDNDVGSNAARNNNVLSLTKLFELKDEIYKPQLQYSSKKLDDILQSILHERAMKMDASYVSAIVWPEPTKPTHADVLAFDVQRGRDHGLQPYYKYLELCSNKRIRDWTDFESVIPHQLLEKLKNVYGSWADVDLIIGGIAERTVNGTVGPTFSCILAEQFSKIHQRQQQHQATEQAVLLEGYRSMNGIKLLCLNSDVPAVPQNIFRLQSNSNRLVDCSNMN